MFSRITFFFVVIFAAACSSSWEIQDVDGDGKTLLDGDCWDSSLDPVPPEGAMDYGVKAEDIGPEAEDLPYDGIDQNCDGKDDFESLKAYVIGDSLKNVAWKAYARGQGLYSKVFQGHVQQNEWLDWDQMPGDDTETKLSYLCYRILYYSENKITFGLRLPSNEFGLASGAEHTRQCLHALALF